MARQDSESDMEVRATSKYVGVSPRKVGLVVDAIRGQKVEDALNLLRFIPSPTARQVAKVVKSAAANAENNFQLAPADLKVAKAFVGDASRLKRHRPRARGRVGRILKRSCHITVIVEG